MVLARGTIIDVSEEAAQTMSKSELDVFARWLRTKGLSPFIVQFSEKVNTGSHFWVAAAGIPQDQLKKALQLEGKEVVCSFDPSENTAVVSEFIPV